jgi:hypothetical protein
MSGDCGCGCGGTTKTASPPAMTGTGFVRPRFFGGMLLTEDDLQATVEYALAKRRLTNRHVIGAGVVCGLEVARDPCRSGVLVVQPGYAIDCCGNDLLVSCPEEVDAIALALELRRRTGEDCGEPCEKTDRRDYHLYLRYAETPTEPVAPYAPDDCATGECEFSRVSEGYRFELRCEGPEDLGTLLDALKACRPPDEDFTKDTDRLVTAIKLMERRDEIARETEAPKPPTAAEFKLAATAPLEERVTLVDRTLAVLAHDAAAGTKVNRRELLMRAEDVVKLVRESPELAQRPAEEQARIATRLEAVAAPPDFTQLSEADRGWIASGLTAEEANREFVREAGLVREAALKRLAARGEVGTEPYRAVREARLDSLATASASDVLNVTKGYARSVDACTCAAMNPPCPTCSDDAVALARVRIDGCDVVEVCALERRWVLSPRALAYWFPIVEALREQLELACCEQEGDSSFPAVADAAKRRLEADIAQTAGRRETLTRIAQLEREVAEMARRVREEPA